MNMICAHLIKPGDTKYPLPCGLNNETLDVFHELIVADEFSRCGSGGVTWALFGGLGYARHLLCSTRHNSSLCGSYRLGRCS